MANIALPAISTDFGTSFSNVRWVVLSYLLASTLFSLIVGRLGDLKGRRKVLLAGTFVFATGTFLCGYSSSFWVLIFARVVQGIGASALIVLPMATVTEIIPREKVGRAIGLLATMSAIGTASGPSMGGFVLAEYGWRAAFFLMTILGGLSFLLLLRFLPFALNSRDEGLENTDLFRTIKSLYSDSLLRTQLFSNIVVSAIMMSTLITGPFYLIHALHMKPAQMGLVMSAGPIMSVFSGILCGYLVDRYGSLPVIKYGFIQILIGALSFVTIPSLFGAMGFVFSAILLSLGYQLFLSANSYSIMKNVSADRRGLVSGALTLSRNLGLISGTFVMGNIFDFFAKATSLSEAKATSNGFQATFLGAALLITFLLINHLKNQNRRKSETRLINQIY